MKRSRTRKPHRRRGGRRKNRKQLVWRKWALLGTTASIAITAAIFATDAIVGLESADAQFCYDRADRQVNAVFLDNSLTRLSPPQLRDYRSGFTRAYKRAAPNSRILLFTTAVDVQGSLVKPVFTICKPPATTQEQADIGAPSKPAIYLAKRAREAEAAFQQAVEEILVDVQDPAKLSGDSPILEQLQSISRYDGFAATARTLTVITDGIQNSEVARFCSRKGGMPSYARFEKRSAYQTLKPEPYTGTKVTLLLVESIKLPSGALRYCTNAEMRQWWPDYFAGNGADNVELTRLRYWAGS